MKAHRGEEHQPRASVGDKQCELRNTAIKKDILKKKCRLALRRTRTEKVSQLTHWLDSRIHSDRQYSNRFFFSRPSMRSHDWVNESKKCVYTKLVEDLAECTMETNPVWRPEMNTQRKLSNNCAPRAHESSSMITVISSELDDNGDLVSV